MSSNRYVLPVLVAVACFGAFLTTTPMPQSPKLRPAAPVTETPLARFANFDTKASAERDITLHAFRDLGAPEALDADPNLLDGWNANWELRWQDFAMTDGRVARVYHATLRRHPDVRFTATARSGEPAAQWERVP